MERLTDESQAAAKRAEAVDATPGAGAEAVAAAGATTLGAHRVVVYRDADAALVRALATELQAEPGTVALLGADDGTVVVCLPRAT